MKKGRFLEPISDGKLFTYQRLLEDLPVCGSTHRQSISFFDGIVRGFGDGSFAQTQVFCRSCRWRIIVEPNLDPIYAAGCPASVLTSYVVVGRQHNTGPGVVYNWNNVFGLWDQDTTHYNPTDRLTFLSFPQVSSSSEYMVLSERFDELPPMRNGGDAYNEDWDYTFNFVAPNGTGTGTHVRAGPPAYRIINGYCKVGRWVNLVSGANMPCLMVAVSVPHHGGTIDSWKISVSLQVKYEVK